MPTLWRISVAWLAHSALTLSLAAYATPAPDEPGPWNVGRMSFTVEDPARERSLPVDVWYPVDLEDALSSLPTSYDLIFTSIASPLALDAPAVSAQGPRPLIVFSHGSTGIRYQSYFLTEALASHGFIVAAPDHVGNTAVDLVLGTLAPFEQVVFDRPRDVSAVISAMLARNADAGDAFAGRIDPARIGVVGHSFGGYTSLAVAGADPAYAADARVRAIVPLAPATLLFGDDDFRAVTVPTLLMAGTRDTTTPIDPNVTRPWELLSSPWRYRADLIDGGHNSLTDVCAIADALIEAGVPVEFVDFLLGQVAEGCAPDLIDIVEAQRVTRLYVTAFLKHFVADDPAYQKYLSPRLAAQRGLPVVFSQRNTGPLRPRRTFRRD